MKHILGTGSRDVLEQYAWSNTLLAFDFDGTLAPIVRDPATARMRSETRERLECVADRYPCAVISGRSLADVRKRVTHVPLAAVVGNHGAWPAKNQSSHDAIVARWVAILRNELSPLAGVVIEDKGSAVAVHYRMSRAKRLAVTAITAAIDRLGPGARVIAGKQVVNLIPAGAPHKGIALERLRDSAGTDTAVYVGDDATDEDVFALDQPGRLLSIRIGRSASTRAPYFLRSQGEIDTLLDRFIALRASRSHRRQEEL